MSTPKTPEKPAPKPSDPRDRPPPPPREAPDDDRPREEPPPDEPDRIRGA